MPPKLDKKEFLSIENVEFKSVEIAKKAKDSGDEMEFCSFKGYASTFGNKDFCDDVIEKGAFANSIKKKMPILLLQHDARDVPIGTITVIKEDEKGLYIEAEMSMDDLRVSGKIAPQMRAGTFNKMSIGYRTVVSEMNDKTGVRTLKEVDLIEISLVTFPANDKASVTGVKSEFGIDDVESVKTKGEFEEILKSTGAFSRKACTYLASKFQETQSDSGVDDSKKQQSESAQAGLDGMKNFVEAIKQSTKNMG